jgi:hypothetical protein
VLKATLKHNGDLMEVIFAEPVKLRRRDEMVLLFEE